MAILVWIGVSLPALAQDSPAVAGAKALDREIEKLSDLPDETQSQKIHDFVVRIRQQPKEYAAVLALNLASAATGPSTHDTLQEVTDTLVDAIQQAPPAYRDESQYAMLAKLARYYHVRVSVDDAQYVTEMSKLEENDRHRSAADFTLRDMKGREWSLKALRGKVVLVNFWATWCPPCRREIPDLAEVHRRFRNRGLLVLAITDEDVPAVKSFLSRQKMAYPILRDPGNSVGKLFRIDSIPYSLVYDRGGHLIAQAIDRPSLRELLAMLAQAGLDSK